MASDFLEERIQELVKHKADEVGKRDQYLPLLGTGILFVSLTFVNGLDTIQGITALIFLFVGWIFLAISLISHLLAYYFVERQILWEIERVKKLREFSKSHKNASLSAEEKKEAMRVAREIDNGGREKTKNIHKFNNWAIFSLILGVVSLILFAIIVTSLKLVILC